MVDETSAVLNREQVCMIVQQATIDLQVHEEFVGLYRVSAIEAATLSMIIRDLFTRMNVCFGKLHGQCYDGAGATSGCKRGVTKGIPEVQPRAVFTHYYMYGHSLNLVAGDTLKQSKVMRNALDMNRVITKLIKYSPHKEAIF